MKTPHTLFISKMPKNSVRARAWTGEKGSLAKVDCYPVLATKSTKEYESNRPHAADTQTSLLW